MKNYLFNNVVAGKTSPVNTTTYSVDIYNLLIVLLSGAIIVVIVIIIIKLILNSNIKDDTNDNTNVDVKEIKNEDVKETTNENKDEKTKGNIEITMDDLTEEEKKFLYAYRKSKEKNEDQ